LNGVTTEDYNIIESLVLL